MRKDSTMLKASEANRLANERIEARVKELLDEVEQLIRSRCEGGFKNATWEAQHVSERTRYSVAEELRRAGYYVQLAPWSNVFIRWC